MFTLAEIIDLVVTVFALGYIFSGFIRKPTDPLRAVLKSRYFNWEDVKYSAIIVAPAVILHELGHKFVGMAMGYVSTFHASYFGLGIGAFLRIVGSPFLFFIPGYVSVPAVSTPIHLAWIAVAGPLVNLALYFISWGLLNSDKYPKYNRAFWLSKQINLLLFAFNMIPFGFFDGAKVIKGSWQLYLGTVGISAAAIYATFKMKFKSKRRKDLPVYRF